MRFVDCFYEIKGELEKGDTFMKKGVTPELSGEVVTFRFDKMEEINVWTWLEVTTWSNEPEDSIVEDPSMQNATLKDEDGHL